MYMYMCVVRMPTFLLPVDIHPECSKQLPRPHRLSRFVHSVWPVTLDWPAFKVYYNTAHACIILCTIIIIMHILNRPFEELITSWLRTVLHFNPKMRGGRRTTTQDAPCLVNMDHILQTKASQHAWHVWFASDAGMHESINVTSFVCTLYKM